ncbi:hypothetical protein NDU88_000004 [Pleurodeles waltl]|uniref:Uncharacterized protein n=1 Tax=Pleurodeles waltl TaxID=8319 RepID=A0AAV7Q642_PLEWA|nr:hypothetical protein NDU88_000004 [Pleurodeles waltl]
MIYRPRNRATYVISCHPKKIRNREIHFYVMKPQKQGWRQTSDDVSPVFQEHHSCASTSVPQALLSGPPVAVSVTLVTLAPDPLPTQVLDPEAGAHQISRYMMTTANTGDDQGSPPAPLTRQQNPQREDLFASHLYTVQHLQHVPHDEDDDVKADNYFHLIMQTVVQIWILNMSVAWISLRSQPRIYLLSSQGQKVPLLW